MGRAVNWDAIPDTGVLPDGIYHVAIASVEETASKNGKLMFNTQLEVMEPSDFAGMQLFELFVIGSDEDPDAQEESTWHKSFAARRMKNMMKAAQVPVDADMDNVIAAAVQQQLVVAVRQEVDDGERNPEYKGRVRNRINEFYQIGHKEVGLTDAPAQRKALASVPKAAAPAAPKAAAPKPAAPAPKAPVAGTLSKPAGAAPKAPTAPKSPASRPTAHCSICDTDVARSEFADHVENHAAE